VDETILGIDVGGTFTDFFAAGPAGIRTWKRLSTPHNPAESVLAGARDHGPFDRVVHGSTVATNALLERRGPRTMLITTRGFRDLLEIRRQVRPRLYDLEPRRPAHVVARGDVIEVEERLDYQGEPLIPLANSEVERVVAEAQASGAAAFAVCFLHSFVNPVHELRIVEALRAAALQACGSFEVSPETREYERASTTAINAFLQQPVGDYVHDLSRGLPGLRVMQSAGGLADAAATAERPVSMVLSGPAGGVLGAMAVARETGIDHIITFDMGGTSTDVALCPGEVTLRNATEIDGLALRTPMVDIETVGAGGGSIAHLDPGGALIVGPESAGADPGPACYGRGGLPTVSDANLLLGRLRVEQPLGGTLVPDLGRARSALATLGDAEAAAAAVIEVVNAKMATALRRVSLERGFDPADFTLVAFGGAGPLHACELAAEVGIPRVLVPRFPGVLSALGMITAPEVVERSHGLVSVLDATSEPALAAVSASLEREAWHAYTTAGGEDGTLSWAADARYAGQAHELRIAIETPAAEAIAAAFHVAHEQRFAHSDPARPVELVTLRARLSGQARGLPPMDGGAPARVAADHSDAASRVVQRAALSAGDVLRGEAVIIQDDATTYVAPGWSGSVDGNLNLLLERTL
jgi:N-methylhydantoinase A